MKKATKIAVNDYCLTNLHSLSDCSVELQIFLTKMTQIRFICVPLQTESSWSVCRWYLYVQEESPGNTEHPTS